MADLKILILLCSAGQPLFFVMNLCSCRLSPSVTLWQLWVLLTTVAPLNPTTSFSSIGRVRCPDVCALQSQGRLLGTLCFVFFFFSLFFLFFFWMGRTKGKFHLWAMQVGCWISAGTWELSTALTCATVRKWGASLKKLQLQTSELWSLGKLHVYLKCCLVGLHFWRVLLSYDLEDLLYFL